DHLGGVADGEPCAGAGALPGELALYRLAPPDEHAGRFRIAAQAGERRRHRNVRARIASHAVDGNRDIHAQPSPEAGRGPATSTRPRPHSRAERYSPLVLMTFLPR